MVLFRDPWHDRGLLEVRELQHNERACSLACVAMLVNAARALVEPSSPTISQLELLERVGDTLWTDAIAHGGDGVTLAELAGLARQSLEVCGFPSVQVDAFHVDRVTDQVRREARHCLIEVARTPTQFVIANFLHSIYTGDPTGDEGHFALVAGYDPAAARVLVLDPDLDDYEPYWVSEETFLEGMATHDTAAGRSRGYLSVRVG